MLAISGNEMGARVATWLELAMAGRRGANDGGGVRMHPLVGAQEQGCVALSLDGRLVHDSDGRLTVFRETGAVIRFLALVGQPEFAAGSPLPASFQCGDSAACLCLRRGRRLASCERAASAVATA